MKEHERWLEKALELADRTSDPEAVAFAEATSVLVPLFAGTQGAWLRAKSHNIAALPLMYQAGFRLQMANACLLVGHEARAKSLIEQVCQMREVLEQPHISSSSKVLRLLGDYHTGRWSELEARAAAITAVMDGSQLELLPVRLAMAEVALARGDLHPSEEVFRTVFELARPAGWLPMVIRAAAGLARAALTAGEAPRASEVAGLALLNMRDKGLWVWGADVLAVAVEARLALGRPDLAGAIVEEFDGAVRDLDAPAALASLTWCRGLLKLEAGDEGTAASLFSEAGSLWDAISFPLGVGRARREAGRALLELEPDKAVAVLREALRIFEDLGAEAEAASVRALFRGRGIPIGRRGGRKAYGDELSPRELQVASLVATGSSNREIAAALFISVRTVEEHVGRVLKKRGLESRVDLIRELAVEKQNPVLLRVDGH
jgi:DNA-binding CsgD family transcriptional regulator